MQGWNFLISYGSRYAATFKEMAREGKNELARYWVRKIVRLLKERGRIRKFDYGLWVKSWTISK